MKRLIAAAALALGLATPVCSADLITFWDTPQYGGNSFNEGIPDEAYFRALKATGATWVRLTFSKWKGEGRDFLIGNADGYKGIPAGDLAKLITCLDAAQAAGIKVVIVPLSLPGDRWSQQNDGKMDDRLWTDRAYWDQSAAFWHDLATALKDHPAVAGYNLINEPTPEKGMDLDEQASPEVRQAWYVKYKGTTHDLPGFYEQLIKAVRAVDPVTPIMVDGGWYANAGSFSYWPSKLSDDKVLYAFHMYEPYEATSAPNLKRKPQLRYPGVESWVGKEKVTWNKAVMTRFLAVPFDWAKTHDVPVSRMVAAEFGCVRQWVDCGVYMNDVLDTLNGYGAHWAFYGYREDGWDAMDYELAPSVTQGQFYYLHENGKADQLKRGGALINIIKAHMTLAPQNVGTATMAADGVITLQLRSVDLDGAIAEAIAIYKPGDAMYEDVRQHLGGLAPGEAKAIPPWPADTKK